MTAFLTVAALMTAIALGFILPILLGKQRGGTLQAQRDQVNLAVLRDQLRELDADLAVGTIDTAGYESARHELEQRVVEDVQPAKPMHEVGAGMRLQAVAIGLLVVAGAAALYAYLGAPNGLDPAQVAAPNAKAHDMSPQQATAMVERLAQRLKTEPDNAEGWLMLGRSYSAMGRFAEASSAYAHLVTLVPGDAQLLTDYADVLGMAQGKNLQGEPEKLLVRALAIDPKNSMTLALLGTAKFERREYAAAIADWQKILTLTPPDSEIARMAIANIKEAQATAAGNPSSQPDASEVPAAITEPAANAPSSTATAATQVAGTVELDPALRSQVADTDTVFIFARAAQGPRFPLAVLRKQVKDLPFNFALDDSMSMTPDAKLSGFPLVIVGARVSKSGSATPSAGDLEGSIAPVAPGSKGLKIKISTRRS
jgi:cytochrome c-type biogenesis protein CcmH